MKFLLALAAFFSISFAAQAEVYESHSWGHPAPRTMVVQVVPNHPVMVGYYPYPAWNLNLQYVLAMNYQFVNGFYGYQYFYNYTYGFNWMGYWYRYVSYYTDYIWVYPGYWAQRFFYIYQY